MKNNNKERQGKDGFGSYSPFGVLWRRSEPLFTVILLLLLFPIVGLPAEPKPAANTSASSSALGAGDYTVTYKNLGEAKMAIVNITVTAGTSSDWNWRRDDPDGSYQIHYSKRIPVDGLTAECIVTGHLTNNVDTYDIPPGTWNSNEQPNIGDGCLWFQTKDYHYSSYSGTGYWSYRTGDFKFVAVYPSSLSAQDINTGRSLKLDWKNINPPAGAGILDLYRREAPAQDVKLPVAANNNAMKPQTSKSDIKPDK